MFKSKLNELCQKSGWESPLYSSIKDGEEHCPVFRATVTVNGSTFESKSPFKTCKLAYNDAAEIALYHYHTQSQVPIDGKKKNEKMKVPTSSLSSNFETEKEELIADIQKTKKLKVSTISMNLNSYSDTGALKETSGSTLPVLPENPTTKVASSNESVISIDKPNGKKPINSFMLCNMVRVYTSIPDKVPQGTIVLPIGDNKWTIVSLGDD